MAAQCTRISHGPNLAAESAYRALTEVSSEISTVTGCASLPDATISLATATVKSLRMSATTTLAPAAANNLATLRPIPRPAPVTTVIWPVISHKALRLGMTVISRLMSDMSCLVNGRPTALRQKHGDPDSDEGGQRHIAATWAARCR